MRQVVITPRIAAPATSHPVARRPRQVSGMPQIVTSTATPGVGAAEGAVEGLVIGGLLGGLVGHFIKTKGKGKRGHLGAGAAIGGALGAAVVGYIGYSQANNLNGSGSSSTSTTTPASTATGS